VTRVSGPGEGIREVLVTDLEMTDPSQLRAGREPDVEAALVRAARPAPELSRFFYRAVGGDWYWLDRIDWTFEQWTAWVTAPGHELWTAWVDGVPAGYLELDRQALDTTRTQCEIAYFGLLPQFTGLGIGGWLLSRAVERAWEVPGTARVWLHTCELDSAGALANYRARGFVPCGTSVEYWDVSVPSPGPWRGSRPPAHRPETPA
jgi:GNAT superfamily N-acetyltransferase